MMLIRLLWQILRCWINTERRRFEKKMFCCFFSTREFLVTSFSSRFSFSQTRSCAFLPDQWKMRRHDHILTSRYSSSSSLFFVFVGNNSGQRREKKVVPFFSSSSVFIIPSFSFRNNIKDGTTDTDTMIVNEKNNFIVRWQRWQLMRSWNTSFNGRSFLLWFFSTYISSWRII